MRYRIDTMSCMAMTLRLTEAEQRDLKARAEQEGVSMQDVARRAIREHLGLSDHRDRVVRSAAKVMQAHADALERLGR